MAKVVLKERNRMRKEREKEEREKEIDALLNKFEIA